MQEPSIRLRLLQTLTDVVIEGTKNYLQNPHRSLKPVSPPKAQEATQSQCITCTIYQEVALARAYIVDLQEKVNPDGSIPAGLGGTIRQAQVHVDTAMTQIPKVMGLNPEMDKACLELSAMLPGIYTDLQWINNTSELAALSSRLQAAGRSAYKIPEAMYRKPEPPKPKEQVITAEVLTEEDRELLAMFRDLRTGTLSSDDAKLRVASLLFPTRNTDDQPDERITSSE